MSAIIQQIVTEFRVRGTGVQAAMGQLAYGTNQWTRSISDATRQSEKLGALWRAFGTTMRYAIAGQVVFGMGRFVTQLREIQNQMGLISAIGTQTGGRPIVGQDLQDLMDQTAKGAIDSLTPVNQYNDAVINLLSTIQDVPKDEITPMVTTITRAAKLSQLGAEDATRAFTTLNTAFGVKANTTNIEKVANLFFALTKEAPGGVAAGQQMAQQMGQLAAMTAQARGTPADMFALMLSGLRGGIPPAQAGRALQFFLQTLAFPSQQTKAGKAALASVGITPSANLPLTDTLNRIFKRAGVLGVSGDLGKVMSLDEESMALMEDMPTEQVMTQMGIQGPGAVFLGTVFRRIHALRMALALSTQAKAGQMQQDLQEMADIQNGVVDSTNSLKEGWKRYEKENPLEAAAVALDSLRTTVERHALAPVINPIARTVAHVAGAGVDHPVATTVGVAALGAAGLAIYGRRLLKGLGGRGVPALAAAQSLASGNRELGTLTNPMFVIIVGDMTSIFNPGGNRIPTPYGPKPRPTGDLPGDPMTKGKRPPGRLKRLGMAGFRVGGTALGVGIAADIYQGMAHPDQPGVFESDFWTKDQLRKGFLYKDITNFGGENSGIGVAKKLWHGIFGGGDDDDNKRNRTSFNEAVQARKKAQMKKRTDDLLRAQTAKSAQDLFWSGGGRSNDSDILFGGGGEKKKELTLNLNIKHPDGTKQQKKVHLPITQYQNGKPPTQGGKVKARGT